MAPPSPPHLFVGTAWLDGEAAPDGTSITAWTNDFQVASAMVNGGGGNYTILVNRWSGETISFQIAGFYADQTATWESGGADELTLTATTARLETKKGAIQMATAIFSGSESGDSVQVEIHNPEAGNGQVAGIRLSTEGGQNVILRTRSGSGNWLELTDGSGDPPHTWNPLGYSTVALNSIVLNVGSSVSSETQAVVKFILPNLPGSGTTDLTIDRDGNVSPQTSTLRVKENVEPLVDNFQKILELQPISFTHKETGFRGIGYAAEALDELDLKELVGYDADDKPLSVSYKMIPVYLLEVLKEQRNAIEVLQTELADLKASIQYKIPAG